MLQIKNIGLTDYKEALDLQENLHKEIVDNKLLKSKRKQVDYLIFCEHPHVYTLGKSGNLNNLLINEDFLKGINASFFKTNRGGDITYHGPGQIVGYPIIDLERTGLGVRKYIYNLEEGIVAMLKEYGIYGKRFDGATGVWLDTENSSRTRKICAIGVRVSRFVTMHGFALNVNTDLKYFDFINPCGLQKFGVTSMERELKNKLNMDEVRERLLQKLKMMFEI